MIVRLIGFFLFTPNASHQRAAKSGGAFASAKDAPLLAVRLDEFVGRSLLHDWSLFLPRTGDWHNTQNILFWCFLPICLCNIRCLAKAGTANIARLSLKYLFFLFWLFRWSVYWHVSRCWFSVARSFYWHCAFASQPARKKISSLFIFEA